MQEANTNFLTLLKECKRLLSTKTKNLVSDDPIDLKIDRINRKCIVGALIATVLIDIFAIPACPMLNRASLLTFDLIFLMCWAIMISAFAFTITGLILFHLFRHDLIDEAKKRGKYLFKIQPTKADVFRSPCSNIITDPVYSFHPSNIHYTRNFHHIDKN